MGNKFQWDRLDEIFMFIIALGFLIFLAHLNMPAEAIMTMGGSLIAVVPIYIKSALERKNNSNGNGYSNGNGNGNGTETLPLPSASFPDVVATAPPPPPVEPRPEPSKKEATQEYFLRE